MQAGLTQRTSPATSHSMLTSHRLATRQMQSNALRNKYERNTWRIFPVMTSWTYCLQWSVSVYVVITQRSGQDAGDQNVYTPCCNAALLLDYGSANLAQVSAKLTMLTNSLNSIWYGTETLGSHFSENTTFLLQAKYWVLLLSLTSAVTEHPGRWRLWTCKAAVLVRDKRNALYYQTECTVSQPALPPVQLPILSP
jgi:hypothetical protein